MRLMNLLDKAKHYENASTIQANFIKLDQALASPTFNFEQFSKSFDYLAIHAKQLLKEYFHGRKQINTRTKEPFS